MGLNIFQVRSICLIEGVTVLKKILITVSYIFVALCFGIGGFAIGRFSVSRPISEQSYQRTQDADNVAGVYYTETWNGEPASMIFYEDGTCQYAAESTARATWEEEGNSVNIYLKGDIHVATIVDDGLIMHNAFFEKKG